MKESENFKMANSNHLLFEPKTKTVEVEGVPFGGLSFPVIAGPCSIESLGQFETIAQSVQSNGACMLRGGVWKLRTSSKSFQGLGSEAFQFIPEVLRKTGMSLVSEITDPRQVETLDPYVSMYQVGSRNMHNYALLKELGLTRKPVMLKRGLAAFVDEWIKAADYIAQGGNERVILCERGIRTFETVTRNTLDLNAVVYLKAHTHYPVIVDPSHGVGIRNLVPQLALAAAAAGADGLMLEVHNEPEKALSDGQQALTLEDFSLLMSRLEPLLALLGRPLHQFQKEKSRGIKIVP
jgi:3-deoxy-7-phosphoheptulonate synthase